MPPESAGTGAPPAAAAKVPTAPARPSLVVRWLVAFGRFWWDFLVGDTPELLIGVLIALGLVALLVKGPALNAAGVAAFPVAVAVLLGLSVYRARPKH